MLPLASVSRASSSRVAASQSFIAFYSTVSGLARRKWGTSGPSPQSLIQTEHAPPPEQPEQGRAARLRSKMNDEPTPKKWQVHRESLKKAFPEGWAPPRKLSRDAMDGLRMLHAHDPETFTTSVLADKFKISPEATRRILRSKWEPTKEQRAKLIMRERYARQAWIKQVREEEMEKQTQLVEQRPRPQANKDDRLTFT